jgi:hypothetical protein
MSYKSNVLCNVGFLVFFCLGRFGGIWSTPSILNGLGKLPYSSFTRPEALPEQKRDVANDVLEVKAPSPLVRRRLIEGIGQRVKQSNMVTSPVVARQSDFVERGIHFGSAPAAALLGD